MKRVLLVSLSILLILGFIMAGCASPSQPTATSAPPAATTAKPAPTTAAPTAAPTSAPATTAAAKPQMKTLRAISFLPKAAADNMYFGFELSKRVAAQGGDILKVDYIGGPEIVPTFDQMTAVRNGTVDMIFHPTSYYGPLLPESNIVHISRETPMQQRTNGFHDFMVEIHKRVGTYYLGRFAANNPDTCNFNLWVNKPVNKIADIKGMRIRTGAIYDEFLQSVGAIPITIAWPDVYDAVKRGVIDGACGSGLEMAPATFAEMFKYVVYPWFYDQDPVILVNLKVWDGLAKEQQALLTNITIEMEKEMSAHYLKVLTATRDVMKSKGMQRIDIPKEEADRYIYLAYSSAWKTAQKQCKPDDFARIQKIMPYSAEYLK
jgi:TRAP-type C4-dicarboxylate transport system substrate-binding protein